MLPKAAKLCASLSSLWLRGKLRSFFQPEPGIHYVRQRVVSHQLVYLKFEFSIPFETAWFAVKQFSHFPDISHPHTFPSCRIASSERSTFWVYMVSPGDCSPTFSHILLY